MKNSHTTSIAGIELNKTPTHEAKPAMDTDQHDAIEEVGDETSFVVDGIVRASALSFITRMLEPDLEDGF